MQPVSHSGDVTAALQQELRFDGRIPEEPGRLGIGLVGCGRITREAHLPAYGRAGFRVVGLHDRDRAAAEALAETFGVGPVFSTLNALLSDPAVDVVVVATPAAARPPIVRQTIAAGKHVLAEKPLAEGLSEARELVDLADRHGRVLAVGQSMRFSPSWAAATRLIRTGAIGIPVAVTHLLEDDFDWTVAEGQAPPSIPHLRLFDFAIHWFDITLQWLIPEQPLSVRAREYRARHQFPAIVEPLGCVVDVEFPDGLSACIRAIGAGAPGEQRYPFLIHGTEGIVSGVFADVERIRLERGGVTVEHVYVERTFPDAFVASMGELLSAIAEDRQPVHSGRSHLATLELTLAACRSADRSGAVVSLLDQEVA